MTEVNNESLSVLANSRVLADITIKLKDGSIADSTKVSGKPSWLVMGDGSFSDAFEAYLIGAKVSDNLTFELPPVDAFGDLVLDGFLLRRPQEVDHILAAGLSLEHQAEVEQVTGDDRIWNDIRKAC